MCYDYNRRCIPDISNYGEYGDLVVRNPKYLTDNVFDLPPLPNKNCPLRVETYKFSPRYETTFFLGLRPVLPEPQVSVHRHRCVVQKEKDNESVIQQSKKTQSKSLQRALLQSASTQKPSIDTTPPPPEPKPMTYGPGINNVEPGEKVDVKKVSSPLTQYLLIKLFIY